MSRFVILHAPARTWVHREAVSRLSMFRLSSFKNGTLRRGQKSTQNSSDHKWALPYLLLKYRNSILGKHL